LRGDGRATLEWTSELRFEARAGHQVTPLDSAGVDGTTPPVLLLEALAGCMAIDVVDILQKGRQNLRSVDIEIVGDRMPDPPRFFTDIHLRFRISGEVADAKAQRAVELSMETYCSVFHTLRKDIAFTYEIEIS
jgi:putative redox protein